MPPILLSEEDVRSVITMEDVMAGLESAYTQEAEGNAGYRPKTTVYVGDTYGEAMTHVTSLGGLRNPPIVVLNIRSMVSGASHDPPSGTYMTMLFSGESGELLAMMANAGISFWRIAGSAGLAAREMARPDAKVLGVLGSGGTARPHPLAYSLVRDLELIKVYSPNLKHREEFAQWITEQTKVPTETYEDPEPVVRGSHIVAACTNTRWEPIIKKEWMDTPGVHYTSLQSGAGAQELELEGNKMFSRLVTSFDGPTTHVHTDPKRTLRAGAEDEESLKRFDVIPNQHTLAELLSGAAPGRESPEERNFYLNQGTGVQYAGTAVPVYQRALEKGVGTKMPEEWFRWFQR